MRTYAMYTQAESIDELEKVKREMTHSYFNLAFKSGLRTGELRGVRCEDFKPAPEGKNMVEILIRAETSKVRKQREIIVDGINYASFVKRYITDKNKNSYLFADAEGEPISEKTLLRHWKTVMVLAGIKNWEERNIVPYTTRHFFATEKLKMKVAYDVLAEYMGTSISELETTYRHVSREERLTIATTMPSTIAIEAALPKKYKTERVKMMENKRELVTPREDMANLGFSEIEPLTDMDE